MGVPSPGGQLFCWRRDAHRLAPWQRVWPRAEPQTLSAGDAETAAKARAEEVLAMGPASVLSCESLVGRAQV